MTLFMMVALIQPSIPAAAAADVPVSEFGQVVDMRQMELAPGAVYSWYDMSTPRGPEKMHAVEFDPKNPNLELQAGTKSGKVTGFQGVTQMANEADRPGNRVIAGINADFYDISGHATGVPNGLFISEGTILSSASSSYAFGLKPDGTSIYGSPKLTKTVTIGGTTTNLTHINRYRGADQLVMYTVHYAASTNTGSSGDEVLLEILEGEIKSGQTLRLKVSEVRKNAGDTPLSAGHVVLSASGSMRPVLSGLKAGEEVMVNLALEGEWNDVMVAVGGQGPIVKDGVVQAGVGPAGVHPRTAIGTKADGTIVLFEIDGRAPGFSEGVEVEELATILRDLGVVEAMNLDGGGSSTFVAKLPGETTRRMLNRGSDGGERKTGNSLLLVNKAPEGEAARLVVQPGFERVLAGATIPLKAAAVDANGHPAANNDARSWSADSAIGSIDGEGRFTAGQAAGEGKVSVQAGALKGTGQIEVVSELTQLKFPDELKAFNSGEKVALSVQALRSGQVVQANNSSLEWRVEGPIGTIDADGVFTATSENSKSGKIYVKHGDVETSMDVEVGTPPVVLEDFEAGIDNYRATGAAYNSVSIDVETNEDLVRFGGKSLRLEYDFVGKTGTSGAYVAARSTDQRIQIPGYPEKISMWVYGDGQKHWLRGQLRDGDNKAAPIDFVDSKNGVNWVGWNYVEATVPKGKSLPLSLDLPVRYMETSNNNKTKGVIYVDQIRAVYGPLTEDRTPPIIKNIAPADKQRIKTALPEIKAVAEDAGYDPVTSPGTTLIDPQTIRLYVDGQRVDHGLYPPKGQISYIPNDPLEEGPHTVKLSVRDMAGNPTVKEWSFYVDLGSPKLTYTVPQKLLAGNRAVFEIKGDQADQLTGGYLEFGFDPAKTDGFEVIPGPKLSAAQVTGVVQEDSGTVRVQFADLASAKNVTDEDVLAQVAFRVMPEAEGTHTVELRSGEVSFEGRSTPLRLFAEPVVSTIETQLTLDWNYEGVTEGFETQFTIKDQDGRPVEGAALLIDGIELTDGTEIVKTNANGMLSTGKLTQSVKSYRLQAVKDTQYSPVMVFTVSKLAGKMTPYNISAAMAEDPSTARRFSWNTNPDVQGTVVDVVETTKFTSFEDAGAEVRRYHGSSRIYHTNNDGTIRVHKAAADGLQPNTAYTYRVGDGQGSYSEVGQFRTAAVGGDSTKFLFFGDSQATTKEGFDMWGETLQTGLDDMPDADFIVHAGDIVDHGHEEEQWNMWFDAAQQNLLKTTLVAVVGNHEVTGENPDVEGDEGKDFTSHFNFPENGIDKLKGMNYSFDYGKVHVAVLNSEYQFAEQRDWLRQDLADTDQPWKIVVFHRGPYGSYYSTEAVKTHWTPVLDEFKVDMVLNGHDHIYLRTYPMSNGFAVPSGQGTVYVIGGSTGPKFYEHYVRPWQEVVFKESTQIYSKVEVEGGTLTFIAKTVDGREVDRFELKKLDVIEELELQGAAQLKVGETAQTVVEAVYTLSGRVTITEGVTYSSSDSAVASVDSEGQLEALKAGTAVITAVYAGVSGSYTLKVLPHDVVLTGIEVSGPEALKVNETGEAVTKAVYSDGTKVALPEGVAYSSSDAAVASVDNKGQLEALKLGTAVITAVYSGFSDTYTLKVLPPDVALTGIEVSGPEALKVGETGEAVTKAVYSDGTKVALPEGVAYSSSDSAVATVDQAGKLKALKAGTTVIQAVYHGKRDEFSLTVTTTSNNGNDEDEDSDGDTASTTPQAPAPSVKPEENGQYEVSELELKEGKTIQLKQPLRELVIPANVTQVSGSPLRVEADNLHVSIPIPVLHELSGLVGEDELAGSLIRLTVAPIGEEEEARLLDNAEGRYSAGLRSVGEAYNFTLSITTQSGEIMKLTQFAQPLQISFKVNSQADRELTGIYYISDRGTLEYVGGRWEDGMLTAEVTHFSRYAVLEYTAEYRDVPVGHWAHDVILQLSAKQLVQGEAGRFSPDRKVTRAEFTAMLVRALKLGVAGEASQPAFADVPAQAWYADDIARAAAAGLVNGLSKESFAPEAAISRQEMAAMIVRAYEYASKTKVAGDSAHAFEDVVSAPEWVQTAIAKAKALGLVNGREQHRFEPEGSATRAESAAVLYELLAKLDKAK
nr:phosphodiester glycosidase family protein [Paenibacillus turpanensis]